jgi:gamma-glutamylcysteine synthetase
MSKDTLNLYESRPLASFYCRPVHMVPGVHYEFSTSINLIELRKIDLHRSR